MHKAILLLPALLASAAQAQYLIDPAGGFELSNPRDNNSTYANRSLGFTGRFFGVDRTVVNVSTNGFLTFGGQSNDNNLAFRPNTPPTIAPLWDNLYVYPDDSIIEKVQPGVYYSVTWDVGSYAYGHIRHAFQVVWFGAETTINGFTFKPNDIAFCYKSIGSTSPAWDATIGMCAGENRPLYATLPGDADGLIASSDIRTLAPNSSETGQFVLFRPAADVYATFILGTPRAPEPACTVDFNGDGFLDFFDYDDFVQAFERGC